MGPGLQVRQRLGGSEEGRYKERLLEGNPEQSCETREEFHGVTL